MALPGRNVTLRPQVIASIAYRDIWGGAASRAELEELLGTVDWRDVVTTAAGIAAISWQHGIEDAEHKPQRARVPRLSSPLRCQAPQ
jgi:hypothetical protein